MVVSSFSTHNWPRLLQLVALAILLCDVSLHTRTASVIHAPALNGAQPQSIADIPQNLQVLSPKDADTYRIMFAAAASGDGATIAKLEHQVGDPRLMGHVLAEYYQHHAPGAPEAAAWMAAYGDLPEAGDIYNAAAQHLGAKAAGLAKPAGSLWSGNDSYETSLDFRADSPAATPADRKLVNRVEGALHRNRPYTAKASLEAEQKKRAIPAATLGALQGKLAAAFYHDGKIEDVRRFAYESALQQNPLGLWIYGLVAWKQQMPAAALAFAQLAKSPGLSSSDRAAASFWAWRAYKRSGDSKQASLWLHQAASDPHNFYGLLASGILGGEAKQSWQLPGITGRSLAILATQPAGWRALALIQIGKKDLAEDELRHLNPQGQRDLQAAMLALAESAHMPSLALRLGGIATNDNGQPYDGALYPLPPWQPAEGFQVDRALIYALMRHESQFDPDAVSDRGACGLLQVMPATARLMAVNMRAQDAAALTGAGQNGCPASLMDPANNMTFGQNYVRRLSAQPLIGDNLVLLLAAYNGGPGRLTRWMDASTKKDPLLFIESMPVRETRDYVRQVLVHYWMYRARLGQPEASPAELARGEWPRYTLRDTAPRPASARTREALGDFESNAGAGAKIALASNDRR